MSKFPKGLQIRRITKSIVYLSKPCTIRELSGYLGIFVSCVYPYIESLREEGYPIKSRVRAVGGRGQKPIEYWIEWADPIIREAIRLILELKKARQ